MADMQVVAWSYQCWDTTHLVGKKLDHYFSTDNGETFVKGEPLVRAADALAAIKAAQADARRYRWLRENNIIANVRFHFANGESPYIYAEALDAAIDHALLGDDAGRGES